MSSNVAFNRMDILLFTLMAKIKLFWETVLFNPEVSLESQLKII